MSEEAKSGEARRYGRTVADLAAAQDTVERYERKLSFYLGRLIAARAKLKRVRDRLERLELEALTPEEPDRG